VARVFTADYVERATLRDGTPIVLRLVVPDDAALLRRGFERWSPESRYARFFSPKQRLTDDELRYLCDVDQEHHFALGAIREAGDGHGDAVGLGIARFIQLPRELGAPVTAEAAIAVADEAQGKGLGRMLFERLVAAAAERGIEHFRCEVLGTNQTMQSLIADVAPTQTREVASGVMSIDFALPAPDASEEQRSESAMYRFFRAAAEGAVEWTDAVRRFWRR
jgi:GNAT superfamily N-acetyltransferase